MSDWTCVCCKLWNYICLSWCKVDFDFQDNELNRFLGQPKKKKKSHTFHVAIESQSEQHEILLLRKRFLQVCFHVRSFTQSFSVLYSVLLTLVLELFLVDPPLGIREAPAAMTMCFWSYLCAHRSHTEPCYSHRFRLSESLHSVVWQRCFFLM